MRTLRFNRAKGGSFILLATLCMPAWANTAYVTINGENAVAMIDTATNTVSATKLVVGSGPFGISIAPDGKSAYVVNGNDDTVSVINTVTKTVNAATIPVGHQPTGIAVTPDGKKIYVTNVGDDSVSVINAATHAVATITGVPQAYDVAIAPDGKTAYVINHLPGPSTITMIDTATDAVSPTTIGVGRYPLGIAIAPDGKTAYVTDSNASGDATMSVINTVSYAVSTLILSGAGDQIAITPDGKTIYVTNDSDTVNSIDTTTNAVSAFTLPPNIAAFGIAFTPDGKKAYAADGNMAVSVIDTTTHSVDSLTVGAHMYAFPLRIAIAPDSSATATTSRNGGGSLTLWSLLTLGLLGLGQRLQRKRAG